MQNKASHVEYANWKLSKNFNKNFPNVKSLEPTQILKTSKIAS